MEKSFIKWVSLREEVLRGAWATGKASLHHEASVVSGAFQEWRAQAERRRKMDTAVLISARRSCRFSFRCLRRERVILSSGRLSSERALGWSQKRSIISCYKSLQAYSQERGELKKESEKALILYLKRAVSHFFTGMNEELESACLSEEAGAHRERSAWGLNLNTWRLNTKEGKGEDEVMSLGRNHWEGSMGIMVIKLLSRHCTECRNVASALRMRRIREMKIAWCRWMVVVEEARSFQESVTEADKEWMIRKVREGFNSIVTEAEDVSLSRLECLEGSTHWRKTQLNEAISTWRAFHLMKVLSVERKERLMLFFEINQKEMTRLFLSRLQESTKMTCDEATAAKHYNQHATSQAMADLRSHTDGSQRMLRIGVNVMSRTKRIAWYSWRQASFEMVRNRVLAARALLHQSDRSTRKACIVLRELVAAPSARINAAKAVLFFERELLGRGMDAWRMEDTGASVRTARALCLYSETMTRWGWGKIQSLQRECNNEKDQIMIGVMRWNEKNKMAAINSLLIYRRKRMEEADAKVAISMKRVRHAMSNWLLEIGHIQTDYQAYRKGMAYGTREVLSLSLKVWKSFAVDMSERRVFMADALSVLKAKTRNLFQESFEWWRAERKMSGVMRVWMQASKAEALRTWRFVAVHYADAQEGAKLASDHANKNIMRKKLRQEMRRRLGVKVKPEPPKLMQSFLSWREYARAFHLQEVSEEAEAISEEEEEEEEEGLEAFDVESFIQNEEEREHMSVAASTHQHSSISKAFARLRSVTKSEKKQVLDADLNAASRMIQSLTGAFEIWAEGRSPSTSPVTTEVEKTKGFSLLTTKLSKEACRSWLQEKYLKRASTGDFSPGGLDILRNKYLKEREGGGIQLQELPKSKDMLEERLKVASMEEMKERMSVKLAVIEDDEGPESNRSARTCQESETEERVTPSSRRVSLSDVHKLRLSLGTDEISKLRLSLGVGEIANNMEGSMSPIRNNVLSPCSPNSPIATVVA